MDDPPQSSARTLRGQFRSAEREAGRLRLLESAALVLAEDSSPRMALSAVLALALRFLGAECGLILVQDSGGLTVQAAQGAVLPVGARIPLGGALGAVMRPPMQPSLREHIESRLRMGRQPEVALELLLPLRLGGKAQGALVLMSDAGAVRPSAEDLVTLQALATLIAGVVGGPAGARPRAARRDGAASLARLTPREQQVLALIPRGLSNAEIAVELGIATGTAKIHIERILHKLGVKDRTQAAVRAAEWGHRS